MPKLSKLNLISNFLPVFILNHILSFILACIVLSFLYIPFANGQTDDIKNRKITRFDFKLTLRDGVILDCTKFVPEDDPPPGGWPAIIMCHGLGRSKEDEISFAEKQAKYGYYILTYSMRGQGKSGGLSNLISTTEMEDFKEVVVYAKEDEFTNGDKTAVMGASQGGIIPFMAACYDSDISCIISNLATPDFASSWIGNGCAKTTLIWSLSYNDGIVRYNDNVKRYKDWILSGKKEKWDSLSLMLPRERDFLDIVSESKVPIFTSNAWQDKFFNSRGMMSASSVMRAPIIAYFGAVTGHGSETNADASKFHLATVNKWLDFYLKGIESEELNNQTTVVSGFSTYPVKKNMWSYEEHTFPYAPFETLEALMFNFHPGGKLSPASNTSSTDTVSFLNYIADSSLTLEQSVNYKFTGNGFWSKFLKSEIHFDTDPLDGNYYLFGSPAVSLKYSSSSEVCQFNFQIWEVTPGGEKKLVTRVNYTDWDNKPFTKKQAFIQGLAHGHKFQKGNKIRVTVTNLDTDQSDPFLKTNPYVLPSLRNAKNIIYMETLSPSSILFPVIRIQE